MKTPQFVIFNTIIKIINGYDYITAVITFDYEYLKKFKQSISITDYEHVMSHKHYGTSTNSTTVSSSTICLHSPSYAYAT